MKTTKLVPGRHTDALVAEKVMRCKVIRERGGFWCQCPNAPDHATITCAVGWNSIKEFSTDIAAAWAVVEMMRKIATQDQWIDWVCEINRMGGLLKAVDAPFTICVAALKALGYTEQ